MRYVKSILAGFAVAIAAAVLWIVVRVVLPMAVPYAASRITGAGGIGVGYVTSDSILMAAVVGFAAGFYWMFRRTRKLVPPTGR